MSHLKCGYYPKGNSLPEVGEHLRSVAKVRIPLITGVDRRPTFYEAARGGVNKTLYNKHTLYMK